MIKVRNILIILAIVFVASYIFGMNTVQGATLPDTIENIFPDTNLADEMVIALAKMDVTDMVDQSDFDAVVSLSLRNLGITNLEGLQYFDNLAYLDLNANNISDISALSSLTNLDTLYLHYNKIVDLSPLSGLTNLDQLSIQYNKIYDLSPLKNLNLIGAGLSSQAPTMTKMLTADGKLIITNPLKDANGDIIKPINISNGGVYDPVANTITWIGVSATNTRKFDFDYLHVSSVAHFTGTVTVTALANPSTTYTVTVTSGGNGTASANPTTATAGTEISLTPTANAGYQFKEWQVVGGGVTITNNKFTMPAGNVEVKAIFEQVPVNPPIGTPGPALDNQPKTGVESYVLFASFIVLVSLGGIAVLKFKK